MLQVDSFALQPVSSALALLFAVTYRCASRPRIRSESRFENDAGRKASVRTFVLRTSPQVRLLGLSLRILPWVSPVSPLGPSC
jgi:hypothetical protein